MSHEQAPTIFGRPMVRQEFDDGGLPLYVLSTSGHDVDIAVWKNSLGLWERSEGRADQFDTAQEAADELEKELTEVVSCIAPLLGWTPPLVKGTP